MALEDFDTEDGIEAQLQRPAAPVAPPAAAPARKPLHPDDEDLFDFPVIEMQLEAEAAKRPAAASAPAPAKAAAPSAPAPAPAKPVAESVPAARTPAPAPGPLAAKAPGSAARPQEKDVAKAAQLVEDIEEVLVESARPRGRARRLQGPSPLTLVGIALLVLTNALGLFFLWRTSHSFQTGVQAMNEQFAETLRRQTRMQSQPEAVQGPSQGSAPADRASAPVPLEAFELSALRMAREEIQAGEYAAARRRLSRLLAAADRIEAEKRGEIEAQASFLLASTYRKQAEVAREKRP